MPKNKNILISGVPGIGKTTLIMKLYNRLAHLNPAGFYTREIREQGVRRGFEMVSFDGLRGVLAHVDIESRHRVGKYKVDMAGFEKIMDQIDWQKPETGLFVIDEIGKMECLSGNFVKMLDKLMNSTTPLVATIALRGGGAIAAIKRRRDVEMYEIDQKNRDSMVDAIGSAVDNCR